MRGNPPRLVQKRQAFVPIRSPGQTPLVGWRNSRDFALSAPRPEYPYEARSHHIMGSGVANLTVLPTSGVVVAAKMEQSIGSSILDNATLSAFRRWRFKPGTPGTVSHPDHVQFDRCLLLKVSSQIFGVSLKIAQRFNAG